jgi:hypothetical protein
MLVKHTPRRYNENMIDDMLIDQGLFPAQAGCGKDIEQWATSVARKLMSEA